MSYWHNKCRRYQFEGDEKPRTFKVGDMFTFPTGETALVTEVFDRFDGKSKYGPEWTLRLFWTPGRDGDQEYHGKWSNEKHGVTRTNMFNQLGIKRGCHLLPVKENKSK